MLRTSLKMLASAALLACLATTASAATVTVSQGLALDQAYGSNSSTLTYSSAFDAAAALGTANFGASYTVNSASISFTWTDNAGDPYSLVSSSGWSRSYGGYYQTSSNCGWFWCDYSYHRSETGNLTQQYATPTESAALAFGAKTVNSDSSGTVSSTSSSVTSNSTGYDGSNSYTSWFTTHTYYYYTDYHDTTTSVYTDRSGSFALTADLLGLGGSAVDDFLLTGKLPFAMTMNGDALLTGATLTLDVTAAVPEPETYAMLLAGLGVIGGMARRRKPHAA